MTYSLALRYQKIKHIYDEAIRVNSSNVVIYHRDPETLEKMDGVTPLDLKYLKDKGFIDIAIETTGERCTCIIINDSLIEYVEEMEKCEWR